MEGDEGHVCFMGGTQGPGKAFRAQCTSSIKHALYNPCEKKSKQQESATTISHTPKQPMQVSSLVSVITLISILQVHTTMNKALQLTTSRSGDKNGKFLHPKRCPPTTGAHIVGRRNVLKKRSPKSTFHHRRHPTLALQNPFGYELPS